MAGRAETFVIVNYGAARARASWAVVRRALADAGLRADAHEARQFGDAREAARAAVAAGYRTVAVVGGDGTLSEVVSGFFTNEGAGASSLTAINPEAALAVLPAGTGNDFARALEGRRASLEHWLARLVVHCRQSSEGTTRAVDVLCGTVAARHGDARPGSVGEGARGSVGSEGQGARRGARPLLCLNAVTLGIGAEVAARVAAQKNLARRLPGETRFALAAVAALVGWRERRVRIRVDGGEPVECLTNLVAIVNSRFAGGGMMFSPEARVDDGLLDVVMARSLSRAVVVREMMRVHRGGHLANPRVQVLRGARVSIEPVTDADALPVEADGDVRGETPLTLRVLPRALRVVV